MVAKPKVLLTGSGGMLGSDFMKTQNGIWEIIPLTSAGLDIRDMGSVMRTICSVNPDFVVNCAAYTKVDDAEDVGSKDNVDVNSMGPYHLAKACASIGCGFVTVSTDYVFDGTGTLGYSSSDAPNPVNAYGMAKYVGEKLALEEYPETVVIRTSWLYGGNSESKNFVNTMLRLGRSHPTVRVVSDQFGSPTYAPDLCDRISKVMRDHEKHSGKILHASNSCDSETGISWYEFAKEIFRISEISTPLSPIATSGYPTKARRPKISLLTNEADPLPHWIPSLEKHLANFKKTQ